MPRFSTAQVQRYYDRQTRGFVAFGQGGRVGAIHRAVWGPGVRDRDQAFHYVEDQIAARIRQQPRSVDMPHVVDLGCGVGASLGYLAGRLPIRGTGVTLSPVQVELASRRIAASGLSDRVTFVEADYCHLPSTLGPADFAYAIESFVHAPDASAFFAECRRLVRPGGGLAICDDVSRAASTPAASRTVEQFRRGWHVNTLLSHDELHALARTAGFEHESTLDLSPYLEIRRMRDRVVRALMALFGWLPLERTSLAHLAGGNALQTCLAHGWIGYELAFFRRVGADGTL